MTLLIILLFFFSKFAAASLFPWPWTHLDPLFLLVVCVSFFRSYEIRANLFLAILCGLLTDVAGLDTFGIHVLLYGACSLVVSVVSSQISHQSWFFLIPVLFAGVFLKEHLGYFLRPLWAGASTMPTYSGLFFLRIFSQAAIAAVLGFPLYSLLKRCGFESIE